MVETGPCGDVLDHPAHPYTMGLIRSLPKDKDDRQRLDPIPGLPPDLSQEIEMCIRDRVLLGYYSIRHF